MSRSLSATNLSQINADHLHEVIFVELAFDTPLYIHSSVGTITFAGNDYIGVGQYGVISSISESERLTPTSLTLQLSGVDASLITEALDAGRYGDIVTIRAGYRQDDGDLVDDPEIIWRGFFEFAAINQEESVTILMTLQHDLAVLQENDGGRFTDEDQQRKFAGDRGFKFVTDQSGIRLIWAGGPVNTTTTERGGLGKKGSNK